MSPTRRWGQVADGIRDNLLSPVHQWRSAAEIAAQIADVHQRTVPWYTRIATASWEIAIIAVPCTMVTVPLTRDPFDGIGTALLLYIIFYLPVTDLFWQRSMAMRQMGQRLVDIRGGKPSVGQVIVRSLLRPMGGFGLALYVLWGTPWLHDGVTRTRVVNEPDLKVHTSPETDV
jgi:uncharacterized RDD family membrane protein YckC